MAGGWSRDGAVQEQIGANVEDAVQCTRRQLRIGDNDSALNCEECGQVIPEPRRQAIPGVRLCIVCQAAAEKQDTKAGSINR